MLNAAAPQGDIVAVSRTPIPLFLKRVRALVYQHEARRALLYVVAAIAGIAHNDFSDVVVPKVQDISTAATFLNSAAPGCGDHTIVLLAGSGATMFMVADASDSSASNRLTMSGVQHRVVHTRTATRVVDVEVSD